MLTIFNSELDVFRGQIVNPALDRPATTNQKRAFVIRNENA